MIALLLAALSIGSLNIGTLTCYTGDSAWGRNACVLELNEPLPANNWVLVQWKETATVMGNPYPEGTRVIGFGYGERIDLIQVQGETLVPKWVDVEIQPDK
jgi:hypothetical protein